MGPLKFTEDTLVAFYNSAKKDLIPFTEAVRSDPKNCAFSTKQLESIFNNSVLWTERATKNGHANYQSTLLPAVHIGFLKHSKDKIYGDHLEGILDGVQKVLNFMGNDVFKLSYKGWNGKKPDFTDARKRYEGCLKEYSNNNNEKNVK